MGHFFSSDRCVDITDFEEFGDELYTVERYFGFEDGWQVSYSGVIEENSGFYKKSAYFDIHMAKWSIYTQNNKKDPEFLQIFRDLSKIYPSRLQGDATAIKEWQGKVYVKLEATMKMMNSPKVDAMLNDYHAKEKAYRANVSAANVSPNV
jgi:hypothetical protein